MSGNSSPDKAGVLFPLTAYRSPLTAHRFPLTATVAHAFPFPLIL